jgi:protein TonB
MKKILLICFFISGAIIAKAQNQDLLYDSKDLFRSENDTAKALSLVDINPEFPGGKQEFGRFIGHNMHIPDDIRSGGRSFGVVFIAFVVEKDGTLTNFKIEKSYRSSADLEALRVIKKSPKWIPGKVSGQPCRTNVCVPLTFTMTEEDN